MNIDAQKVFGQRECPSCGYEVPTNSNRCPICRYEFLVPTAAQRFTRVGGALIMLAIMLWLLISALR